MYSIFLYRLLYRYSNSSPKLITIKMQLRSGKTTQPASSDILNNMRFYGQIHRGNITMTMKPYTPPGRPPGTPRSAPKATGKKSKPTIVKHSMTLRARKQPVQVEQEPQHFADSDIKPRCFHAWLLARLKGFITTFNQISTEDYTERIMERSRLFMEMTAVLREHIDYITTSPSFAKFSHVLYEKLLSFKNELTILLNGEKLPGSRESCNFSPEERAFLGNVRADIVNLSVITKHRLPKLSVV